MKEKNDNLIKMRNGSRRFTFLIVIFLNIVLLSSAFLMYGKYATAFQESLLAENLGNIANLNSSSAINATSLISSWNTKLNDLGRYVEIHDLSYTETLKRISDSNSNPDRYFELIGSDYTGHVARENKDGTFTAISYADSSYSFLRKVFDDVKDERFSDICFAPEFTDNGETGEKFFAIYKHLSLTDDNGKQQIYTLLLATPTKNLLGTFNNQTDFKGQSSVLIDTEGNYIVSNNDFKSNNFFNYIYLYNDLTLDQKNDIQNKVSNSENGDLYYKNAGIVVEDCVYRYEKMSTNDWYCVTCVPISSFRTPEFNSNYVVYTVIFLIALLIVDVAWFQTANRRLRISTQREIEASAAKGNFMSRMSHEIRTPLNAVIGYNTLARNELSGAKTEEEHKQAEMKVMDCLTKSSIASKHLLTIINDVLDMSAIESGKIKVAQDRFDFKSLITSLTTVFFSQAKTKDVRFEVVFGQFTEEWFVGDQMRTNQILTNLLSNAVKFTPEGGRVKLIIDQTLSDEKIATVHFSVEDTGIGMSREYLDNIWTPFEQADSSISRRFGGTGLGLAITKNLVDIMNGTISVKSELGVGTVFNVELKFERTEQPDVSDVYSFEGVKALVVDDDKYTCDYIKQMFDRCGSRCDAVTSGSEAMELFLQAQNENAPYSVCLVDWQMPQMNGIELVRQLKANTVNEIPIIVITAYDFTEIADEAASVGVSALLPKPLFQSSLFDFLANISGKKPPKAVKKSIDYDFGGAKLLLAEDNAMNMEIAKRILESAGFIVECAWNGEEAVDKFKASSPGDYKTILMDVHMPVMNGHEATKTIRSLDRDDAKAIPIIAMTADAFTENVSEALEAGMNDHISKPIDVQKLFETLKQYINSEGGE